MRPSTARPVPMAPARLATVHSVRRRAAKTSGEGERSESLDLPQQLLVLAIALMPLQSALTYDLGFPLKPSEVLVIISLILCALTGRLFDGPRRFISTETWVLAFGLLVVVSALATFARPDPTGPLHGFTRSPTIDAGLYTFYGALVISMWAVFRQLPRATMAKAVIASIWIAAGMLVLQVILTLAGDKSLLHELGYHVVPPGRALPGIGASLPRNGSFVEGQHLGFFCGVAFFVAVAERRKWAAIACLAMLVVSQSTTGFVAIVLGYTVALVFRPTASSAVKLFGALAASGFVVLAVPALRTAVQIQLGKLGLLHTNFDFITKSIDLRAVKTDIGLHIMWDHPLLGVGPGRYGVAFYDYVDPSKVTASYFDPAFRALAENVYAQIGAEFGVIALTVFCVFVLGYLYRAPRAGTAVGAAAVALALGLATQSDWTFLPAWTFLAYLSATIVDASTLDSGEARVRT